MEIRIDSEDKLILQELAKKQMEYAVMESNQKKIKEWYAHNDLQGERPMFHLELGTFMHEIVPQRLQCQGEYARRIETTLITNFVNQELFDDDRVTPDYYPINYDSYFTLFGLDVKVEHTNVSSGAESLGHHFIAQISDLEEDYSKLKATEFGVNMESTNQKIDILNDTFGHILPIRLEMGCLYSVPTQMMIHIMSMENFMFAMYDYPELFQEMMGRIADDTLAYYRMLEEKKLILPTTCNQSLGQGTWCYTKELPGTEEWKRRSFTTKDVWGFMDSQETVGISPQMYEEFIFPCYKKIADQFGMMSYGCCEPVHPIWENCISKLSNLRKVSISPWCDEEYMGERLRGSKVIFHRKPSPNFLGVGTTLDEAAFREHLRKTVHAAKGCKLEVTQRDVYTINHDIKKAQRYVDIMKEEIMNCYK